jgi:hypothetical protein
LSAGDFDGNGVFDLAVGVPYENLLTETSQATVDDAGAAHVIFGSDGGLTVAGNQLWHQDSPGIAETCEADDYLGSALASGYKARTQIR